MSPVKVEGCHFIAIMCYHLLNLFLSGASSQDAPTAAAAASDTVGGPSWKALWHCGFWHTSWDSNGSPRVILFHVNRNILQPLSNGSLTLRNPFSFRVRT